MKGSLKTVVAITLMIMAGCAAPQKKENVTLFYPPAPELPRLQWLAAYTGAKDVEPEKSGFDKFVIGEKESSKRLDKPYGAAIFQGKIYVCDTNQTVMVFDLVKNTYGPLRGAQGAGKLVQPVNISVDREGNKYVADPIRGQVVEYGRDDLFVKSFGTPGSWKPVDAVMFEDRLYVADVKNGEVVVFDKDTGEIVKRIGKTGEFSQRLYMPTNLAFDGQGTLYASDPGKFEVFEYDRDGHFKGTIGQLGQEAGRFARPKGIAADRDNRLYVVDAAFQNVQLFTSSGQLLLWFGSFGTTGRDPGDLFLPAKVVVDYDNVKYFTRYAAPDFDIEYIVLVVSQFGDKMVNVYGFGKERGKKYPSDEELMNGLKERLQKMKDEQSKKPADEKKEQK